MLGRPALIPGASRRRAHLRDLTGLVATNASPARLSEPGVVRKTARRPSLFEHARTASLKTQTLKTNEQKAD